MPADRWIDHANARKSHGEAIAFLSHPSIRAVWDRTRGRSTNISRHGFSETQSSLLAALVEQWSTSARVLPTLQSLKAPRGFSLPADSQSRGRGIREALVKLRGALLQQARRNVLGARADWSFARVGASGRRPQYALRIPDSVEWLSREEREHQWMGGGGTLLDKYLPPLTAAQPWVLPEEWYRELLRDLPAARCILIQGPAGSGKSTLVRGLAGFCRLGLNPERETPTPLWMVSAGRQYTREPSQAIPFLIEALRAAQTTNADATDPLAIRFETALFEWARRTPQQRLAVIIDGLDEALDTGGSLHSSLAAHLPASIPDSVTLILTTRPGPTAQFIASQYPGAVHRLEWSARNPHARNMAVEIATQLWKPPSSPDERKRGVARFCESVRYNPLLIGMLLSGEHADSPGWLNIPPTTLEAFFEREVLRLETGGPTGELALAVLEQLATADDDVPLDELCAVMEDVSPFGSSRRLESALELSSPFLLHINDVVHKVGLVHATVREWMRSYLEAKGLSQRVHQHWAMAWLKLERRRSLPSDSYLGSRGLAHATRGHAGHILREFVHDDILLGSVLRRREAVGEWASATIAMARACADADDCQGLLRLHVLAKSIARSGHSSSTLLQSFRARASHQRPITCSDQFECAYWDLVLAQPVDKNAHVARLVEFLQPSDSGEEVAAVHYWPALLALYHLSPLAARATATPDVVSRLMYSRPSLLPLAYILLLDIRASGDWLADLCASGRNGIASMALNREDVRALYTFFAAHVPGDFAYCLERMHDHPTSLQVTAGYALDAFRLNSAVSGQLGSMLKPVLGDHWWYALVPIEAFRIAEWLYRDGNGDAWPSQTSIISHVHSDPRAWAWYVKFGTALPASGGSPGVGEWLFQVWKFTQSVTTDTPSGDALCWLLCQAIEMAPDECAKGIRLLLQMFGRAAQWRVSLRVRRSAEAIQKLLRFTTGVLAEHPDKVASERLVCACAEIVEHATCNALSMRKLGSDCLKHYRGAADWLWAGVLQTTDLLREPALDCLRQGGTSAPLWAVALGPVAQGPATASDVEQALREGMRNATAPEAMERLRAAAISLFPWLREPSQQDVIAWLTASLRGSELQQELLALSSSIRVGPTLSAGISNQLDGMAEPLGLMLEHQYATPEVGTVHSRVVGPGVPKNVRERETVWLAHRHLEAGDLARAAEAIVCQRKTFPVLDQTHAAGAVARFLHMYPDPQDAAERICSSAGDELRRHGSGPDRMWVLCAVDGARLVLGEPEGNEAPLRERVLGSDRVWRYPTECPCSDVTALTLLFNGALVPQLIRDRPELECVEELATFLVTAWYLEGEKAASLDLADAVLRARRVAQWLDDTAAQYLAQLLGREQIEAHLSRACTGRWRARTALFFAIEPLLSPHDVVEWSRRVDPEEPYGLLAEALRHAAPERAWEVYQHVPESHKTSVPYGLLGRALLARLREGTETGIDEWADSTDVEVLVGELWSCADKADYMKCLRWCCKQCPEALKRCSSALIKMKLLIDVRDVRLMVKQLLPDPLAARAEPYHEYLSLLGAMAHGLEGNVEAARAWAQQLPRGDYQWWGTIARCAPNLLPTIITPEEQQALLAMHAPSLLMREPRSAVEWACLLARIPFTWVSRSGEDLAKQIGGKVAAEWNVSSVKQLKATLEMVGTDPEREGELRQTGYEESRVVLVALGRLLENARVEEAYELLAFAKAEGWAPELGVLERDKLLRIGVSWEQLLQRPWETASAISAIAPALGDAERNELLEGLGGALAAALDAGTVQFAAVAGLYKTMNGLLIQEHEPGTHRSVTRELDEAVLAHGDAEAVRRALKRVAGDLEDVNTKVLVKAVARLDPDLPNRWFEEEEDRRLARVLGALEG